MPDELPSPGPVQAPKPLQLEVPAHSVSGSVPALTLPQVPFAPPVLAAEQAWQRLPHEVLQQTLSTQLPLVHALAPEQPTPLASLGTQAPAPLQ